MFFEEYRTRDLPKLPTSHKFHWLEKILLSKDSGLGLHKKDLHDKEHERQLITWGCDPKHTSKLTIRKDENGVFFADRFYHCVLHLKLWKDLGDKGPREEAWKRFEAESGLNLDDLTLPQPTAPGHEAY